VKPFDVRRYARWAGELVHFWRVRRSPLGFVALSTRSGVKYVPLPPQIWSTKSHEWWVLLAALLHRLQPRSLLELGSGRSTIYLSEYACKYRRSFVSVDEDPNWVAAGRTIARLGGLRDDLVHHVPLSADGFYDERSLERLIVDKPDFIYLDGPIRDRSGLNRREVVMEACRGADVIVIDDVQWRHIHDQMSMMQHLGTERRRTLIEYSIPEDSLRVLCVLTRSDLQPAVDDLVACLGISTLDDLPRERCIRD
jgi:hypothetical protein